MSDIKFIKDNRLFIVRDSVLYNIDWETFQFLFKQYVFRYEMFVTCCKYYNIYGDLLLVHQFFKIRHFNIYDLEYERILNGET